MESEGDASDNAGVSADPDASFPADDERPTDPVGDAVADALRDLSFGGEVSITHTIRPGSSTDVVFGDRSISATGPGPAGWTSTITVQLEPRVARLIDDGPTALRELLGVLPVAGMHAANRLRQVAAATEWPLGAALRRAVRDTVATTVLDEYFRTALGASPGALLEETIDYLIELSGTRVEAHELTHGVVIADALTDAPRLELRYPADLRPAKRAPLLFDGRESVLVVDPAGRARTELQRHRFDRLGGTGSVPDGPSEAWLDSGSLVAHATRALGGIGFYVRGDRTIWAFVGGQPLLVRRGEHWTAFPVELAVAISNLMGGGMAAELVARAAYMISSRPQGAILAVVDDVDALDAVVSGKDRYDLRHQVDPAAMRPETRLHHLIDAEGLDEHTLARLAALDGATVLHRDGQLVAYGAIVTSSDSEHEGARTAAARSLSLSALVVLKVSVDGDITIFREGATVTTLLGSPSRGAPRS